LSHGAFNLVAQKDKSSADMRDPRLLHREFQLQRSAQKLCELLTHSLGVTLVPITEYDEIVTITGIEKVGESMSFPLLALRSVHLGVLSHEAVQCMEIGIRKDTTDNPPLGYTRQSGTIAQALQTSRSQKTPNQMKKLVILDTTSEQAHQLAMSN
jgi:hypothetical protein